MRAKVEEQVAPEAPSMLDDLCLQLFDKLDRGDQHGALEILRGHKAETADAPSDLYSCLCDRLISRFGGEPLSEEGDMLATVPSIGATVTGNATKQFFSSHYTLLMAQVERQRSQIQRLLAMFE